MPDILTGIGAVLLTIFAGYFAEVLLPGQASAQYVQLTGRSPQFPDRKPAGLIIWLLRTVIYPVLVVLSYNTLKRDELLSVIAGGVAVSWAFLNVYTRSFRYIIADFHKYSAEWRDSHR